MATVQIEDGIIFHEFLPNAVETLETAKENMDTIIDIQTCIHSSCYQTYPISHQSPVKYENYASSDEVKQFCKAVASISKTKTGKVIGNFSMSFNKTEFLFHIFTTKDEAMLQREIKN